MVGMRSVGVKELKQNASRVLEDVEANGETVVTVSGRPVAVLVPLNGRHRWISTAEIEAGRARTGDESWLENLRDQRAEGVLLDPFGD